MDASARAAGEAYLQATENDPGERERLRQQWERFAAVMRDLQAGFEVTSEQWQAAYGVEYPGFDLEAWKRLAARAGISADFIIDGKWKPRDLAAVIEGYLQRLADARSAGPAAAVKDARGQEARTVAGKDRPADTSDPLNIEEKALALLTRDFSVAEIAKQLGLSRSALYKKKTYPRFNQALQVKREARYCPAPPRGEVDADGYIEAWE